MADERKPRTLVEAVRYFADPALCVRFVAALRWPDGPICPRCGGREHSFTKTRSLWKCKACKRQFTVKQGSIFEDSPIALDKWLVSIWLIANSKNGISSYELARALGISQKSAWFVLHRIRLAMQSNTFDKLSGEVEADETLVGGKDRFKHIQRRRGNWGPQVGKTAVVGLLERHGQVRAAVVPNRRKGQVQAEVRQHVEKGATLYTDAFLSYRGLEAEYIHEVIDHSEAYVEGRVHTNGIENFWTLLKRGLKGTYVSVEPFQLFRYLDERVFTFNQRELTDYQRFVLVLRGIAGRRLTWGELTGALAA